MDKAVRRGQFTFYYIWSHFKKRIIPQKAMAIGGGGKALTMLLKKWVEF